MYCFKTSAGIKLLRKTKEQKVIFNYNGSEHFNVYPGSYQGVRPDTLSELREGAQHTSTRPMIKISKKKAETNGFENAFFIFKVTSNTDCVLLLISI